MPGYAVIIEGADSSFSAYVPELPGCVATGSSVDAVDALIGDAVRRHVSNLRDHGDPVPEPTTAAVFLVVSE